MSYGELVEAETDEAHHAQRVAAISPRSGAFNSTAGWNDYKYDTWSAPPES